MRLTLHISRRTFTSLIIALAALPPATIASESNRPGGRIAVLADAWDTAGNDYEAAIWAVFGEGAPGGMRRAYADPNCPELVRFRASRERMLDAAGRLMMEPSRAPADVAIKYHAIETFFATRTVWDEDVFVAAGGYQWYAIVEAEAERFGIVVNQFWRWGANGLAQMTAASGSDPWAGTERWRTAEYLKRARHFDFHNAA